MLQTEDYARAALQRGMPTGTKEEIQRLVEARIGRQATLTRDPPLRLWTIVDEAALHRPVGGRHAGTASPPGRRNCVEVAIKDSVAAVRDSKKPDGPKLTFSSQDWGAFLRRVKDGEHSDR